MAIFFSYFLIVISSLLIAGTYYVLELLGGANFFEIMFHLFNNGTTTAGSSRVFIDGVKACLWVFILSLIILLLIRGLLNKTIFKLLFAIVVFLVTLFFLLRSMGVFDYISKNFKKTDIYEKYYTNPKDVGITFNNKRNLILIYLESMESSFFSKENGGDFEVSRIPELETLAKENTNFSNNEKLGGFKTITKTSFTAASLIASTTGTPINTKVFDGYSEKTGFMNNVRSLGDVLKENDYNLEIIQGTDLAFANEGIYFKNHGDYKLFDYNAIVEKGLVPKGYFEWWGIEDSKLLNFAKDEILELSKQGKPFQVSLFTMDTHFKDGYVDESCNIDLGDHLSNAYACSSKMVNEFVSWIKSQDFYKDTTVILIGDHITTQNSYFFNHKGYDRSVYNAIINSNKEVINTKNRKFTSFDLYPTILSAMGADIEGDKLGFGTNLFSDKKTLAEELGFEYLDEETRKNSDYYNTNLR